MVGVDFVINALFETSGVLSGGDCARGSVAVTASKPKPTKAKIKDFTALILSRSAECKAAKYCRTPNMAVTGSAHFSLVLGVRQCFGVLNALGSNSLLSVRFFQFLQ